MMASDTSSFAQTLSESGNLVERGAPPPRQETPISNTGLSCCDLSSEVKQSSPQIEKKLVGEQPQFAMKYSPHRFTSRCDWLQGTFKYESLDSLLAFRLRLAEIFKDTWEEDCGPFTSGVKFDNSARSAAKIIMAWQVPNPEKPWKIPLGWLCIPGSAIDRLMNASGIENLFYLFDLLDTGSVVPKAKYKVLREWKVTRLDTTIDDFEKRVRPKDILEIAEKGNYAGFNHKGHFNKIKNKWESPKVIYQQSSTCDSEGKTVWAGTIYFGSSQSDKMLYIYDKFLQSEGKIDSVRWECRWKDEYAHVRFRRIVECLRHTPNEVALLFASLTTGAIDFIDRHHSDSKWAAARVAECPRYAFWQEFLDSLGTTKISISAPEITAEKIVKWWNYQCATGFYAMSKVSGFDSLIEALERMRDNAEERMTKRHETMVNQAIIDKFDIHKCLDKQFEKYRKSTDIEFCPTG